MLRQEISLPPERAAWLPRASLSLRHGSVLKQGLCRGERIWPHPFVPMGKIHVVCSSVLSYLTVRFHFVPGVWGTPQQASFVLPNDILAGTAPPSAALSVTAGSIIGSGNNAFLSLVSVPIGALQRVQPPMPPHPAPQSAQIGCLRFAAE